MAEQIDIQDFLLGDEAEIAAGDELRVRPWSPPATTYGQGTNTGPVIDGVKLKWGQPVTLAGDGDITPAFVQANRPHFMSESQYQNYQTAISNE